MNFDQTILQQLALKPKMLRLQNKGFKSFPAVSDAVKSQLRSVEALNLQGNEFQDFHKLAMDLDALFPALRYLLVDIPAERDQDDELIQELIVIGDLQALNDLCLDEEQTMQDYLNLYAGIDQEFDENSVATPQPLLDSPAMMSPCVFTAQALAHLSQSEFESQLKPGLTALRAAECEVNLASLAASAETLEYLDLTTSTLIEFAPEQLEPFKRLQCLKNEALTDQQIQEIIAVCDNMLKINIFDLDENIQFDEDKYNKMFAEREEAQIDVRQDELEQLDSQALSNEILIEQSTQEQVNRQIAALDDRIHTLRIINCNLTYIPQPPFSNAVQLLVITGSPALKIRESFDDLSYYHELRELQLDDCVFQAIDYRAIQFYCKRLEQVNGERLVHTESPFALQSPASPNQVNDNEMAQLLEDVAKTQDPSQNNVQYSQSAASVSSSALREEQLILKNDQFQVSKAPQLVQQETAVAMTADQIVHAIPQVKEYLEHQYDEHADPEERTQRSQKYVDFSLKLLPKNYINQTQLNIVIQEFHQQVQDILQNNLPEQPDFKQIYTQELANVREQQTTVQQLGYFELKSFAQHVDATPLKRERINANNKLAFVLVKMAELQEEGLNAQRASLQSVNRFYERLSDQTDLIQALQVNAALKRTLAVIRDAMGQQEDLQEQLYAAFSHAMSQLKRYIQNLLFYKGRAQKEMFLQDVRSNQQLIKSDFIKVQTQPKSNLFTPVQITLIFQQAIQAFQAAEVQKAKSAIAADLIDYTGFMSFFNNQFFAIKFGKIFAALKRVLYYQSIERNITHALVACISNCLKTNQIKFYASELQKITQVCTDLLMGSVYEIDGRIEVMDQTKVEKKVKQFKAKRIPIVYWKDSLETIDKMLVVDSVDEDITFDEMVGYVMQWKMAQ